LRTLRAEAPTRADLAGGTLDLWPLSQLADEAVTVNLAIDVRTGCEISGRASGWELVARSREGGLDHHLLETLPRRPERVLPPRFRLAGVVAAHFELPPCRIETWSRASPGSGLGGSSSLVVSLVAAAAELKGVRLADAEAVSLACNLETRVLGLPGGSQDHWAAQCGGLSVLEYRPAGTRRTELPRDVARRIADSLVVADTRIEHHSGMNNWAVLKAVLERDAGSVDALAGVSAAACAMRDALLGDPERMLERVGAALRSEWRARRRLAPAVTSPEVDRVIAAAESAGGAAKVCGAGGGGCVACVAASPADRPALAEAVRGAGAEVLDAPPAFEGVRVSGDPA
jgi:D-glycero-alpha-D-manno-heptose-7-phosphate kinase